MLSKQQPKLRNTKMELLNSSNASDHALLQQQEHEVVDNQEQEEEQVHVLAVDDSLIDRKVLEKLLTVSSYQVTCVDSGEKALEYLGLIDNNDNNRDLKVNLIMTDYCMPGMSGYDLLKRVKESSWKDVPVVVMSSENVPSRISMCKEEGAEEFLLKPLQLADVEKLHPCLHLKSHNATKTNPNHKKIICNNIKKRKAISPSHRRTKIKGPIH